MRRDFFQRRIKAFLGFIAFEGASGLNEFSRLLSVRGARRFGGRTRISHVDDLPRRIEGRQFVLRLFRAHDRL